MNKVIKLFLNCCIIFVFALILAILIVVIKNLASIVPHLTSARQELELLLAHPEITNEWTINIQKEEVQLIQNSLTAYSIYTILGFLAIAATTFIFVVVNPKLFRLSTYTNLMQEWKQNKDERTAAKAEKAEADKQAKIAELEAALEKLKKD